ncbi:T9SS type A sorting domain-containing protein [Winogradskyella litoriviva]|uniref:T9SS type A sorting domain-containing protein n=1 Tax=Winogradskyella litoriviva TaxID=1220182 RepID=A0ABX2E7A7_9FLAO|nr:T9SS type A sorting domain-containing protein [Winogradskyella litoriviva]NRD24406.1 T9SS type A sorting domain-containing protein [Winogradskyella litoriviva]
MKTKLLFTLMFISAIGYSQVQPTVHNATFDNIPKSSGSDCACSGWINKDIADQGESSSISSNDVVKMDNLESDGIYQEVAVEANSDYTLDIDYRFSDETTTTQYIEVIVLKGSGYVTDYTPAYDLPADAAQDGFGYDTVAAVELAANQVAYTTIVPSGSTSDLNPMVPTLSFNTGSETSIAIFIRAVGPYDAAIHGDSGKDKGWMNGDTEVRMDNLSLVNLGTLSTEEFSASNLKVYPNPASTNITIKSANQTQIDSVELYNILGSRVLSSTKLIDNSIDVSEMASGVYLLKVNAGNNSVTKRIVIE